MSTPPRYSPDDSAAMGPKDSDTPPGQAPGTPGLLRWLGGCRWLTQGTFRQPSPWLGGTPTA